MGSLTIYLDASFIVSLFVNDPFSDRVEEFVAENPKLIVSDFASAEFMSAVGIRVRMGSLSSAEAQRAFSNFDRWASRSVVAVGIRAVDISVARTFLRQLELKLRAPDAIHLAAARRLDATVATFDKQMMSAAQRLAISVARA